MLILRNFANLLLLVYVCLIKVCKEISLFLANILQLFIFELKLMQIYVKYEWYKFCHESKTLFMQHLITVINICFAFQANLPVAGLTNLGNTCYMNSVLQALYATKSLREFITDGSESGGLYYGMTYTHLRFIFINRNQFIDSIGAFI